jgi:oxygen-independent coproporphyrinogen-3 oxidase
MRRCSYCDFNSFDQPEISVASYLELLLEELRLKAENIEPQIAPTVYFGGGTPSLLAPDQITRLIQAARNNPGVAKDAEITLEANPGTVTLASLQGYLAAGVNRLSLGVQSLDDRQLALLGRIHSADEAREAFNMARAAGFSNIGIDLMHGLPGQTLDDWQSALSEAIDMKPEHISAYGLSVEDGTPFAAMADKGELILPEEELAAGMLEMTSEFLRKAGYEHYEISNFALPGYRSCHNQVYWRRGNYLGFGAGAHSFLSSPGFGRRWENPSGLLEYAAAIKGKKLAENELMLSGKEAMSEFMFLGLRLLEGVDREEFAGQFGMELEEAFPKATGMLCEKWLLIEDGSRLRLTSKGLLLANVVMSEFV